MLTLTSKQPRFEALKARGIVKESGAALVAPNGNQGPLSFLDPRFNLCGTTTAAIRARVIFGYGWTLDASGRRVSENGKLRLFCAAYRPFECSAAVRLGHGQVTAASGWSGLTIGPGSSESRNRA